MKRNRLFKLILKQCNIKTISYFCSYEYYKSIYNNKCFYFKNTEELMKWINYEKE